MRPTIDPTLYLVTDPELGRGRPLAEIVRAAVRGGVTLVQLRDKRSDGRALLEAARSLKALLEPPGIPLLVNDRADVAAAAGVGCHLGQSDLPPAEARAILGRDAPLGLSLDAAEQVGEVDPDLLDYFAFGPFAATATKGDAGPATGAARLAEVRALVRRPLVAIGGIDATNAGEAIRAGADGVAVVSAIVGHENPEGAARALRRAVEAARGQGGAA